jgi:phosphate acyltransferase
VSSLASLPVAVDAMGGDRAPAEIVAGARAATDELGVDVVLVGPPDQVGDTLGLELVPCTEVIGMDEDPAQGVRRKKDSSLVRAAELVRDGAACAMVSAGNTGATMAAALLRMGRIKGVNRPCIATPLPRPGRTPGVLVDAGANAECSPQMLLQFAQMASAFARARHGTPEPTVGLLSIGEEASKGTPLVKETHALLAAPDAGVSFFGNVEGRDLLDTPVDVVVTDGFTGNVALKSLEGALRFLVDQLLAIFGTDEATKAAADVLLPYLLPLMAELDPEGAGGAMLLGLDGVCIISHGSSSATAMKNAIKVGHDLAAAGITEELRAAIGG